jgi:hypothetical protein
MKPFYAFLLLFTYSALAYGQQFHLKDLVDFTGYTVNKFDNHITKKKEFHRDYYAPQESTVINNYIQKQKKDDQSVRTIAIESKAGITAVHYQTSLLQERDALLQQLKATGFKCYTDDSLGKGDGKVLQHGNLRVYTSVEARDSISLYTFIIERKELPKAKDLVFAEDLLPINSHEYLCSIFGEGAVKKDVFYYSETETNTCSVLFPNTNRQLIFVWNDEKNYSNTAFILVGGQLRSTSATQSTMSIEHNLWRSRQGVYSGMTLRELQALNEEPINFYSWGQEQEGMLAPKNHGKLDFTRIGLVMNCLNCNDGSYQQAEVVSSESQIQQDKKVYVSTIIILPEKDKQATASR